MRLLILATSYPTEFRIYEQAFVRARVRGYHEAGIAVTVLSFAAKQDYPMDGVEVVTLATVRGWQGTLRERFDVVVSHAPNVRQHMRFLWPRMATLPPVVLTFHGHETMRIHNHYPPPYPWFRSRWFPLKRALQGVYDAFKLRALEATIERLGRGSGVKLVYVSEAMKSMAFGDLGLPPDHWADRCAIIPNPIGVAFEKARHCPTELLGDFVTIRPLDTSKMAIDMVVEVARQNPQWSFHVYGTGRVLRFLHPPVNLVHFEHFLENDEIPDLLNRYRAALMPSRCDAQGVMMCEMASTGMPVVASDIEAHREALREFPTTALLDNERPVLDAEAFFARCATAIGEPSAVYHQARIIHSELELFRSLCSSGGGGTKSHL